jgi:hypothetical protein
MYEWSIHERLCRRGRSRRAFLHGVTAGGGLAAVACLLSGCTYADGSEQRFGQLALPLQFTRPEDLESGLANALAGGCAFAATNRLPATHPSSTYMQPGGLMVYRPNVAANFRRAAAYVAAQVTAWVQ